jgi:hypothetical protein
MMVRVGVSSEAPTVVRRHIPWLRLVHGDKGGMRCLAECVLLPSPNKDNENGEPKCRSGHSKRRRARTVGGTNSCDARFQIEPPRKDAVALCWAPVTGGRGEILCFFIKRRERLILIWVDGLI